MHDMFNVTHLKPFSTSSEKWFGNNFFEGEEIKLKVTFVSMKQRVPYICADIDEER